MIFMLMRSAKEFHFFKVILDYVIIVDGLIITVLFLNESLPYTFKKTKSNKAPAVHSTKSVL